jgi:hypothetical protein
VIASCGTKDYMAAICVNKSVYDSKMFQRKNLLEQLFCRKLCVTASSVKISMCDSMNPEGKNVLQKFV